jgi:peptidyl-tRNA hydrolase
MRENENANLILVDPKFESKLRSAIEGLTPYFHKLLLGIPRQNSSYIVDYVINDLKRENNASINYIRMNICAIVDLTKNTARNRT